jgi:tetratricopeptide (TPR) repeat protein
VSYGKAIAYLPVIDLLRAYFQVEARDDVGKIRAKVTAKVLSLDRQLEPFVPALLSLLDALPDDPHWARLDPSQRRQKTLDSVKRLLFRESQMQPLLVLFEDLHWIDSETQALLDILVESLPGARVLLLVNYRPEYSHGWGSKTYYRQLRIDSLAPQSAQELLQPFLGDDPSLEPLKRILIERTEGNPLFLEESARTIVDTHVLVGHRGAYRLPNDAHSIQIPITVQAILAARIDRLPPEDKRLLQAAAVIGKDVPFDLLEAIAELPDEELRRGLTRLQASELVYEARLFPDLEYTFKHALTHEVAYGSLLHERRRELHARIVVTLERLHANRLDEHMERLGHHALQAGLMARAVPYLRRAGMRAFLKSANREAAAWFERALTALRQLPEDRATAELGIDLRIDLRHALFQLGEWSRVHDYLVEADALAQTLGDHRREGQVASFLVNYFTNRGDPARAIDSGHQALRAARAAGDAALEGATNFYLSNAFHALGDYERATAVSRGNVEVLDRVSTGEHYFVHAPLLSVLSRASWARSIAERGELVEAIAHADESVRLAAATERPFHIVFTLLASGGVRLVKGDPDEAIRLLERGLALAQEANIPLFAPQCAALLGHAYMLSARLPEALPLLEEAAGPAGSAQQLGGHARRVAYLSEAYLAAGRVAEAAQLAEQARALAREHQERGNEAHVLRVLGEVAAHRDRPEAEVAADHYDQARALASELGMRPLVAHCHLGLGQLYGHTGQREQGLGHLATARAMYREMEMGYWLEQAEVEFEDLKQAGKEHGS